MLTATKTKSRFYSSWLKEWRAACHSEEKTKTIIPLTLGRVYRGRPLVSSQVLRDRTVNAAVHRHMRLKSRPGQFRQIQRSGFINLGNFSFTSLLLCGVWRVSPAAFINMVLSLKTPSSPYLLV